MAFLQTKGFKRHLEGTYLYYFVPRSQVYADSQREMGSMSFFFKLQFYD
jgi:hypothetical protein